METTVIGISKVGTNSLLDSPGNILSPLPDTSSIPMNSSTGSTITPSLQKSTTTTSLAGPPSGTLNNTKEQKENIPMTKEFVHIPISNSSSNESIVSVPSFASPIPSSLVLGVPFEPLSAISESSSAASASSSASLTTVNPSNALSSSSVLPITPSSAASSSSSSSSDKFEILRLKEQIQALKAELVTTKAKCNALQSDNARLKMQLSRTNNSLGSSNNLNNTYNNNARSRSNTAGTGGASSPLLHDDFYFFTNSLSNTLNRNSNPGTGGPGSTPVPTSTVEGIIGITDVSSVGSNTGLTGNPTTGSTTTTVFLKDKILQAIPRSSSMGTFIVTNNNTGTSTTTSATVSSSSSPTPNTNTVTTATTTNNNNNTNTSPSSSWSTVTHVYRERTGSIPTTGTDNNNQVSALSPATNSTGSGTIGTTFRMPSMNFTKTWNLTGSKDENNNGSKPTVMGSNTSSITVTDDTKTTVVETTNIESTNTVMATPIAMKSSSTVSSSSAILHTPVASSTPTPSDTVPTIEADITGSNENCNDTTLPSVSPLTPVPNNAANINPAVGFTVSLSAFSQISGSLFAKPKSTTTTPESTKGSSINVPSLTPVTSTVSTASSTAISSSTVPNTVSPSTISSSSSALSTNNSITKQPSSSSSTSVSSTGTGSWSNWFTSTFSLSSKDKFSINTERLKLPVYRRQRSHSFIDLHGSDHYILHDLPNLVNDIDTRDANIIAKFSKLYSYTAGDIIPSSRMVYVIDGTVHQYPVTAVNQKVMKNPNGGGNTEGNDETTIEKRVPLWSPSSSIKHSKGLVQITNNSSILASSSSSTVCSVLPRYTLRILSWLSRARSMEPTIMHDPTTILNRVKQEIQNSKTIQNYFFILQRNKDILNRIPLSHNIIVTSATMESYLRQAIADLVRETGLYINGVLYTLGTTEKLADIIYHHLYVPLLSITNNNVSLSTSIVKRLLISSSRTIHGGDCMKLVNDNFMNTKENFTFLAAETGGPTEIILHAPTVEITKKENDENDTSNGTIPMKKGTEEITETSSSSTGSSSAASLLFVSISAQNCFRMMQNTNQVLLFRCILHEKITIPNIVSTDAPSSVTDTNDTDTAVWLEERIIHPSLGGGELTNDSTVRAVDMDIVFLS